jgi:hypothetical protein
MNLPLDENVYVSGVCLSAGDSHSGHVYTKEAMEKAVTEWNEKTGAKLGSMNSEYPPRLEDITHEVSSLELDGDDIRATCRVLGTPKGEKLKQLLEFAEFEPLLMSVGYPGQGDFTIKHVSVIPKIFSGSGHECNYVDAHCVSCDSCIECGHTSEFHSIEKYPGWPNGWSECSADEGKCNCGNNMGR